MTNPWTAHEDEILTRDWYLGYEARKIAERLTERTRSAVIGRAHRLGLSKRDNPCKIKKPPQPKVYVKKICINPDCGVEITGVGGHRDRMYCTQGCANAVYRAREEIERSIRPGKQPKSQPCNWSGCPHCRIPGHRYCYQINDRYGHGVVV